MWLLYLNRAETYFYWNISVGPIGQPPQADHMLCISSYVVVFFCRWVRAHASDKTTKPHCIHETSHTVRRFSHVWGCVAVHVCSRHLRTRLHLWGREYSTLRSGHPVQRESLPTHRRRHERASTQGEAVDARENEREGAREVNNNWDINARWNAFIYLFIYFGVVSYIYIYIYIYLCTGPVYNIFGRNECNGNDVYRYPPPRWYCPCLFPVYQGDLGRHRRFSMVRRIRS